MTMLTVGGRGYRVHPVQGQVTLADVVAARDSLQRIIDDFAAARAETADATVGTAEPIVADYAHAFTGETDTAEQAPPVHRMRVGLAFPEVTFSGPKLPRRRSVAECMVILLNDPERSGRIIGFAAPGHLGDVIHDVAVAMAGDL